MAINPKIAGIAHIALRSSDFDATKHFYLDILGFKLALESPDIIAMMAGPVLIAFKKANAVHGKDVFTPFNIGLDHIAFACESLDELNRVAKELTAAGVENTGVKTDDVLQKQYVAFKDPDRLQWEFYMV